MARSWLSRWRGERAVVAVGAVALVGAGAYLVYPAAPSRGSVASAHAASDRGTGRAAGSTARHQPPTTTAPTSTTTTTVPTSTTTVPTTTTTVPTTTTPRRLPALAVSPASTGGLRWSMAGPRSAGQSTMYVTTFHPDAAYPSEVAHAVWMNPRLLSFNLVPGSVEPGGVWAHPFSVAPSELSRLAAAFNGGFQFRANDARGGFYLDGVTAVPLVQGAASLVIYDNGTVDIGSWGTQVGMTPKVRAVLQNVVLMVDNGQVSPATNYTDISYWGFTLGNVPIVPRAGLGVTAAGDLVYVAGPALTSRSLAEALQRAGAVRGMTLDINPWWVTFNLYSRGAGGSVSGHKLYSAMQRSADRYLPPYPEARDFVEVLTR